jgi:acyl carrier protein
VTGRSFFVAAAGRATDAALAPDEHYTGENIMTDQQLSIEQDVRNFVISNFLFGVDNGLTTEQSFLSTGIIDSTGVLELVAFLEDTYQMKIADNELVPENLDSLQNVTGFVGRKLAQ